MWVLHLTIDPGQDDALHQTDEQQGVGGGVVVKQLQYEYPALLTHSSLPLVKHSPLTVC